MDRIRITRISDEKRKKMNIPDSPAEQGPWAVWECAPSSFDWHYSDQEVAYVYEGKVKVKTLDEEVEINPGDLVIFPSGLSCHWEVLEAVRKVYKFE